MQHRVQKSKKTLEDAIDTALEEMPKDFTIRSFLLANKAEVKSMCLTEFNEEEFLRNVAIFYKNEARAEGIAEGRAEGEIGTLAGLVEDGFLTLKQAAQRAKMTVPAFKKAAAELKKRKAEV